MVGLGISSIDGMNQTISTLEPQTFRISTSENRENFNLRWSRSSNLHKKQQEPWDPPSVRKPENHRLKTYLKTYLNMGTMLVPQEKLYFTLLRVKSFKKSLDPKSFRCFLFFFSFRTLITQDLEARQKVITLGVEDFNPKRLW